jgi:hypothetical protein
MLTDICVLLILRDFNTSRSLRKDCGGGIDSTRTDGNYNVTYKINVTSSDLRVRDLAS